MTPEAIASRTGWPLELLLKGIEGLCQSDPRSRSKAEEGKRLVLIDAERGWGWRVVNIGVYRSKASDLNQSGTQVADGRNAEKVRRYKERHRKTPVDTRGNPGHQNSDSDSDSDSNTDLEKNPQRDEPSVGKNARKRATSASTEFPLDFALDDALRAQALKRSPDCDVDASFAQFRAHHEARGAKFKNWRQAWATWIGNYEQFGYPKRQAANGKSLAETYPGYRF